MHACYPIQSCYVQSCIRSHPRTPRKSEGTPLRHPSYKSVSGVLPLARDFCAGVVIKVEHPCMHSFVETVRWWGREPQLDSINAHRTRGGLMDVGEEGN